MKKNKTTILIHLDSLSILDELTNDQAGILLRSIKNFNSGEEVELDPIMKMVFLPFKNQFIRDNNAYNEMVEQQRLKGLLSASKRQQLSTTVDNGQPNQPLSTLKDKDKDKDKDKGKDAPPDGSEIFFSEEKINKPSLEEVQKYFVVKGYTAAAANKPFMYYQQLNWHTKSGEPITDWKQTFISWMEPADMISKPEMEKKIYIPAKTKNT